MRIAASLTSLCLLFPEVLCAQDFTAVAFRVLDGDSVIVRNTQGLEIEIRLADIDAPERDQPYADAARDALRELVLDKTVEVRFNDVDDYGRIVARLYAAATDVSAEMLDRGLAWVYVQYLRDRSLLAREAAARDAGRGLWGARDAPVPPWEWRRAGRASQPVPAAAFSCAVEKTFCRQMTSCEEARFYLRQCGIRSLDGDDDGRPCEDRCR
ncbi:MAG TPA: thermonuclease family protein [Gammaproteobacteria bacterium]|nr:thermonuclease family protein [Gammaproteobacteria bacterium]